MDEIKVEMFKAQKGDCFLISLGDESRKNHILIDGGFEDTYVNYLKERLVELSNQNEELLLAVVTHIDSDHIEGILELIKENNESISSNVIPIREVWHNSYRHLQLDKIDQLHNLTQREKSILEDIIVSTNTSKIHYINEDKGINAEQGSSLASLLYKGKYNWNSQFSGMAVSTDNKRTIKIDKDIIIHLLAPNNDKLEKLKKYWLRELRKKKYDFKLTDDALFDDAYEFYLMNEGSNNADFTENKEISLKVEENDLKEFLNNNESIDTSPTNGSSISFIIEYKGKKMLFLGDSHPQLIRTELKKLLKDGEEKLLFDLIKISHHGSHRNINKALLEIIDSQVFLISTNGETHKHPHKETIAKIVCRACEDTRDLIFNYRQTNQPWDEDNNKQKYNFRVYYPNNENSIIISYKGEKIEVI